MKAKSIFKKICNYFDESIKGTEYHGNVYAVGGIVRDIELNPDTADFNDIDFCITLLDGGIKVSNYLYEKGLLVYEPVIYPTYGTSMFKFKEFPDVEIEIVPTRKEQYKDHTNRFPETSFTPTIYEDAIRRDLTINALYYDISNEEIVDPTGLGMSDLQNRILRSPNENPEETYEDDGLRIMRAVRFYGKMNSISKDAFSFDTKTYDAIKTKVHKLSTISKERITDELNKMLLIDKHAVTCMKMLMEIGAWKYIIPEMEQTVGMEQNKYHFGDVWVHTIATLDNMINAKCPTKSGEEFNLYGKDEVAGLDAPQKITERLAALLHDIGKSATRTIDDNGKVHFYEHEFASERLSREILTRLRYPKAIIDNVCFLVKWHMFTKQWQDDCSRMKDKTLRKLQYICGYRRWNSLMRLINADNLAHKEEHCLPNQVRIIYEEVFSINNAMNHLNFFEYELPLTGNEIMEVTGEPAGPNIKKYKEHALKFAFSNPFASKQAMINNLLSYKKQIEKNETNNRKI